MGRRSTSVVLALALGSALTGCSGSATSPPAAVVASSSLTAAQEQAVSFCQSAAIRAAHVLTSSFHVADTASENRVTDILAGDGFDPARSALAPVVYNAWITYSLGFLGVPQESLPAQVRSGCSAYVTGPAFRSDELALLCRWEASDRTCTRRTVAAGPASPATGDTMYTQQP